MTTVSLAALALALGPFGLQARADDAHHPGKVAKAKNTDSKTKQSKKLPTKPKRQVN